MTSPIRSLDLPTLSAAELGRIQRLASCEPSFSEDDLKTVDWTKIRLEEGKTMLPARAFLFLWNSYNKERESSMLERIYLDYGIEVLSFCILSFSISSGKRCVPCLCRDEQWYASCYAPD